MYFKYVFKNCRSVAHNNGCVHCNLLDLTSHPKFLFTNQILQQPPYKKQACVIWSRRFGQPELGGVKDAAVGVCDLGLPQRLDVTVGEPLARKGLAGMSTWVKVHPDLTLRHSPLGGMQLKVVSHDHTFNHSLWWNRRVLSALDLQSFHFRRLAMSTTFAERRTKWVICEVIW